MTGIGASASAITYPRPVVHWRVGGTQSNGEEDHLSIIKAKVDQEGIKLDEEHSCREQERKDSEDE